MPGQLTILDEHGIRQTLQRHDPSHAEKTLGIYFAMDGNTEAQEAYLTNRVKDFAHKIRTSKNKLRNDVWVAVKTTIMKTLEYPMAAICLSKEAWDKIMGHLLKICLPCSGFARTFPHCIIYGPTEYAGLGIMHPWYNQELSHLEILWGEVTAASHTGELFQTSMEQLTLELGFSGFLTDIPFNAMAPSASDVYLKTLWCSCSKFDIAFDYPFPTLDLKREDDLLLMEIFHYEGKYKAHDLKMLNECRMFLQAVTLADITTVCGRSILTEVYEGHPSPQGSNTFQWPRPPPSLSSDHWKLWKAALETCFTAPGTRTLRTPLGDWLIDPTDSWRWFYFRDDEGQHRLLRREPQFFIEYVSRSRGRGRSGRYTQHTFTAELPRQALLASVKVCDRSQVELLSTLPRHRLPPTENPSPLPTSVQSAFDKLPEGDQWALQDIGGLEAAAQVARSLRQGTAIAVSDGSYDKGFGTSSFVVHCTTTGKRIKALNTVPGHATEQSSYRSELAGIAGTVAILTLLCQVYQIQDGSIEIGLDNEGALNAIFKDWDPKITDKSFDLIFDIRRKLQRLPLRVKGRWIESHQDDKEGADYDQMDIWTLLNIEMDLFAGEFLTSHRHTPVPNHKFGDERMAVYLSGRKLSHFDKTYLYREVLGTYDPVDPTEPHRNKKEWHPLHFWQERDSIPTEMLQEIHWEAHGKAFRGIPFGRQRWLSKHCTGQCAVGRMAFRRKHQDHSACPRCQQMDETTKHVVQCNDA